MADSSGNIIYIIAVIIVVLSSVLSKKKKSGAESASPSPSTPKGSWEDVIREITMDADPKPVPASEPTAGTPVKVQPKPFLDEEKMIHKEAVVKRTPVVHNAVINQEELNESISLPDFSNYDDVKRGIIFSEIFHRKF